MNILKDEWHQEDNSLFLLHIFLGRNYMEDHNVWVPQIQIQTSMWSVLINLAASKNLA